MQQNFIHGSGSDRMAMVLKIDAHRWSEKCNLMYKEVSMRTSDIRWTDVLYWCVACRMYMYILPPTLPFLSFRTHVVTGTMSTIFNFLMDMCAIDSDVTQSRSFGRADWKLRKAYRGIDTLTELSDNKHMCFCKIAYRQKYMYVYFKLLGTFLSQAKDQRLNLFEVAYRIEQITR